MSAPVDSTTAADSNEITLVDEPVSSSSDDSDADPHYLTVHRRALKHAILQNDTSAIDLIVEQGIDLPGLSVARRQPPGMYAGYGWAACWYMLTLGLGLRAETRVFRHLIDRGLNDWTDIDEELIDNFVMDVCHASKTQYLDIFLAKGGADLMSHRQLGGMLMEIIAASGTEVDGRVPGVVLVERLLDKSTADPNFPCTLLLPDQELWMGSTEGTPWSHRSALCDWSRDGASFLFPPHGVEGDYAVSLSPLSASVFYDQFDIFDLLQARATHMDANNSPLSDSLYVSTINLQVPAHQPLYVALDKLALHVDDPSRVRWLDLLSRVLSAGADLNARALVRFGEGEKTFQMYVTPALLILTRIARTGHAQPPWHPHQNHRDGELHEALLTRLLGHLAEGKMVPAQRATLLPDLALGGSNRFRSPFHLLMDGFRARGTDTHRGSWDLLLDPVENSFNRSLFGSCIKLGALGRNGGEVLGRYFIQPTSKYADQYRESWRELIGMIKANAALHGNLGQFLYQYVKTVYGAHGGHEVAHGILDPKLEDVGFVYPAQFEVLKALSAQRRGIINYRPTPDSKSALHHVVTIWTFNNMGMLERTLSMAKAAFIRWLIKDLHADKNVLWQGVTPWEFILQQTERVFANCRRDKVFGEKEENEMREVSGPFQGQGLWRARRAGGGGGPERKAARAQHVFW